MGVAKSWTRLSDSHTHTHTHREKAQLCSIDRSLLLTVHYNWSASAGGGLIAKHGHPKSSVRKLFYTLRRKDMSLLVNSPHSAWFRPLRATRAGLPLFPSRPSDVWVSVVSASFSPVLSSPGRMFLLSLSASPGHGSRTHILICPVITCAQASLLSTVPGTL